jgi:hypothetical protein
MMLYLFIAGLSIVTTCAVIILFVMLHASRNPVNEVWQMDEHELIAYHDERMTREYNEAVDRR